MDLALIATLAGSLLLAAPAIAQDSATKKPISMQDMTAYLAANPPRPISPASESSIPLSSAGWTAWPRCAGYAPMPANTASIPPGSASWVFPPAA